VQRDKDEQGIIRLRALVKLHRNLAATEEELMKYCARRLHADSLPDSINIEQLEENS
jgi:hypothetical protein